MPIGFAGWALVANTASSAYAANKAADTAKEQMRFQAGMSNSSFQRGVADMRAAGLNPILAYQQGGASTPAGAQPSQFFDASKGISSALEGKRLEQELKNMESGERLNHALADQSRQTAVTAKATAFKEEQQGRLADAQRETVDQLRDQVRDKSVWDAKSARWMYETDRAQGEFDKAIGEESRGVRLLMELMRGHRTGGSFRR